MTQQWHGQLLSTGFLEIILFRLRITLAEAEQSEPSGRFEMHQFRLWKSTEWLIFEINYSFNSKFDCPPARFVTDPIRVRVWSVPDVQEPTLHFGGINNFFAI